jgi:hypothetical protein
MINKETETFVFVADKLRKNFNGIYVIGAELTSTPPQFPAVSIVQTNNAINESYSTFGSLENVAKEDYKVEVCSNLEQGKEAQARDITTVITDAMSELGYVRIFCEPIVNADSTVHRRMSRYRKNNVI